MKEKKFSLDSTVTRYARNGSTRSITYHDSRPVVFKKRRFAAAGNRVGARINDPRYISGRGRRPVWPWELKQLEGGIAIEDLSACINEKIN